MNMTWTWWSNTGFRMISYDFPGFSSDFLGFSHAEPRKSCIPRLQPAVPAAAAAERAALKVTTLGRDCCDSSSSANCHCWAWESVKTERNSLGEWFLMAETAEMADFYRFVLMNFDHSGKCIWEVFARNVVNNIHEAIFGKKSVSFAKNKHWTAANYGIWINKHNKHEGLATSRIGTWFNDVQWP